MTLPAPGSWTHDAADIAREESKRQKSPASFFFSQGQALVLAVEYFKDSRLNQEARGGVAGKHRHRMALAVFGQLLASLEFLFKDFVAKVIDVVPIFDEQIVKAEWIKVDAARILSMRAATATAGSLLMHPASGWQQPEVVNRRYQTLFSVEPIANTEISTLEKLWTLRHSVAHNAGFVSAHDAARSGMPDLAGKVADIDQKYISDTFDFLCGIAKRIADKVGDKVMLQWLGTRKPLGPDYLRDKATYTSLKLLGQYIPSRTSSNLDKFTKGSYTKDFNRAK